MNRNNKLSSIFSNSAEEFSDETREEMEQLWERSAEGDPAESITVSEREVREAYDKVNARIGAESSSHKSTDHGYLKYAAAAVFLLFAVGLAYILIPVTVEVPNGQTKTVMLPDQSTVELNSGSQISYSRLFNWWGRKVSLRGEAFFDVQSNGLPFQVTTPNAAVKVVGTKFNVRYWPSEESERTSIFLKEGTVSFAPASYNVDPVMLEPGQMSWISNKQKTPASPVKADPQKAVDWQRDSIAFEGRPLSSVFAELQRRFDVDINVHPDVANEKLTIYLSEIRNAESAISDICRARGLTYKQEDGKFLIY